MAVSDKPVEDFGDGLGFVTAREEGNVAEGAVLVPEPGLRGGWRGGAELLRQNPERKPDILEDAVNGLPVRGDEFIIIDLEQVIGVPVAPLDFTRFFIGGFHQTTENIGRNSL